MKNKSNNKMENKRILKDFFKGIDLKNKQMMDCVVEFLNVKNKSIKIISS